MGRWGLSGGEGGGGRVSYREGEAVEVDERRE